MKINNLFIVFFFMTTHLASQSKSDYQWVLDHYNLLDFRQDTLTLSNTEYQINYGSGDFCTSICNSFGELQFYSGGCHVLNKEGNIMENGDSINSDYAYADFCGFGDYPYSQNNIILPFPLNNRMYYYFNLDINIINNTIPSPLNLYYHTIDMNLNGGLGAVVKKKEIAISDTLSRGYIQAVQHSNLTDWWVIVPELNSNCYYIIPVTTAGVGTPKKQCVGKIWNNQDVGGQAVFSPNGKKYARIGSINGWCLFDFNTTSGVLSNPIQLVGTEEEYSFRGVAFSATSRFLYVSAKIDLYQFDLEANDIIESKQLVGQLNPDDAFPGVGTLSLQKLAPNGKIYIASPGSHKFLSVINRPNCLGTLSDFQPWAIELPGSNYAGLPNLPHFNIPTSDLQCDPLVSTSKSVDEILVFELFPNPALDVIYIHANEPAKRYFLFNSLGTEYTRGKINNEFTKIDISHISDGLWFLRIEDEERKSIGLQKIIVKRDY